MKYSYLPFPKLQLLQLKEFYLKASTFTYIITTSEKSSNVLIDLKRICSFVRVLLKLVWAR